jgi:type II secretory pathway predicted ATPase ExeA/cell division septation protein DedD
MDSPSENSSTPLSDASASGTGTSSSLTYEPFYGLREKAFSLSADPRFLYKGPAHAPAFDAILAGIRRREGLIVLTGEIGTGKTTLCRAVLQQLDRRTFAAFIPDPFVSREDLLKTLLVDFGVIAISDLTRGRFHGASRSELSYLLYEFLDSLVPLQAFAVLVIDETQNLSLPLLEEIRILSELERREKLLQVVLVGQPELRSNLRLPQMRQVDQRVSVRCELTALDAEGVAAYVHHRLVVAGLGGSSVEFTPAALEALYHASAGVPRVINRLCDRALERAYAGRTRVIEPEFVSDPTGGFDPAADVRDRATDEAPAASPPIVPTPAPSPRFEPVAIAEGEAEGSSPLLAEFRSEAELSMARSTGDSIRRQWVAVGISSMLIVAASVGVPAWYLRAHAVDDTVIAAPQPPVSPDMFSPPSVVPPNPESADRASSREADATAAVAAAAEGGNYTIVVASFTNPERAQHLVEELTAAGYRARAVEHDSGLPRGRWLQVNVGGYASADEAERDLQQIRLLPGGYQDARIVDRQ